jgi:NitT/TauT family transport system permease protein
VATDAATVRRTPVAVSDWARDRVADVAPPLVTGLVILACWEGVLAALASDSFLLPSPSVILAALVAEWQPIWAATRTTGYVVVTGLAAGITLGVAAALVAGRFRVADETITPLAVALNAMPIIALAPLFNAWFGITSPTSNQAVVVVVVFFPVFINTAKGLTRVEPIQLELMHCYAASEWRITREVRIPNALPLFFAACRLVASLSVIAAIVAEYFGGRQDALGPIIVQRAGLSQYDEAWAAVAAGAAMGIALYLIVAAVERIATPWHTAGREGRR